MTAYLADNRHHGYRIDFLQRKMLESGSVLVVSTTDGRDPTISLNGNRGKRGSSFEVVGDEVCGRGGSSESQGNSVDSLHCDGLWWF